MDWVHINYNKLPVKSIGYADSNRHKDFAPTPLIIMDSEVVLKQIILTEIYLQSVLGENISLTILDLGLDADVRSLKKAAALLSVIPKMQSLGR
jgi:hypothetical protein